MTQSERPPLTPAERQILLTLRAVRERLDRLDQSSGTEPSQTTPVTKT